MLLLSTNHESNGSLWVKFDKSCEHYLLNILPHHSVWLKISVRSNLERKILQSRHINRYDCFLQKNVTILKKIEFSSALHYSVFSWQFSKMSQKIVKRNDLPCNDLYGSTVYIIYYHTSFIAMHWKVYFYINYVCPLIQIILEFSIYWNWFCFFSSSKFEIYDNFTIMGFLDFSRIFRYKNLSKSCQR